MPLGIVLVQEDSLQHGAATQSGPSIGFELRELASGILVHSFVTPIPSRKCLLDSLSNTRFRPEGCV